MGPDLVLGVWIDFWYNLSYTSTMKTAISLPDELFQAADRLAKRLGLSRSELYQRALAKYLDGLNGATVTTELDKIYGAEEKGRLDPALDHLQRAGLAREDW